MKENEAVDVPASIPVPIRRFISAHTDVVLPTLTILISHKTEDWRSGLLNWDVYNLAFEKCTPSPLLRITPAL